MAGRIPASLDLDLIRGDSFSMEFQLKNSDTLNPTTYPQDIITGPTVLDGVTWTPFDLTSFTVKAQIRKTKLYAEPLAVPFTVTMINAAIGHFKLTLTQAQTTSLAVNDSVSYTYDLQVETADGTETTTYLNGAINIILDVTR